MIHIAYFLLLLFLLYTERQYTILSKPIRFLIPCIYVLLIGLRGNTVGVDTNTYYHHYYEFGRFGCDFVEPGFDWVNRFCFAQKWLHYTFFIFCAAMAIFPPALAAGKRLERNEYSIFMLLLCTTTFAMLCNGMRQGITCGLLFFFILLFEDDNIGKYKRLIIYTAGLLFASLFHASVLLCFPLFLLKNIRLSDRNYMIVYLISFVFIIVNVSSLIPSFSIANRTYEYSGEMLNTQASWLGFSVRTVCNITFLILLLKGNFFERYTLLANIAFLSLICTNVGFHIPIISRINMYFTFFVIMMYARVFADDETRTVSNANIYLLTLALLLAVLNIYGVISPANRILPYTFWWECSGFPRQIL